MSYSSNAPTVRKASTTLLYSLSNSLTSPSRKSAAEHSKNLELGGAILGAGDSGLDEIVGADIVGATASSDILRDCGDLLETPISTS